MVEVQRYERKRKPPLIKLFMPKLLRTKIEYILDKDITGMRAKVRPGSRKARYEEAKLDEIHEAIGKKATKEEQEAEEVQLEADMALAELEGVLKKLSKEEAEVVEAKKIEEDVKQLRNTFKLKLIEAQLPEYEQALSKRMEVKELADKIRTLRKDIESGKLTEEERTRRIEEFVLATKEAAKKFSKKKGQ